MLGDNNKEILGDKDEEVLVDRAEKYGGFETEPCVARTHACFAVNPMTISFVPSRASR